MAQFKFQYKSGHWIWDDYENCLEFISYEVPIVKPAVEDTKKATIIAAPKSKATDIQFRNEIGLLDKIRFRKLYQRKILQDEPEVIILQDVKDVAFFTANPKDLTTEIIDFLHAPIIDRLLKALIVYFQFYLQVWQKNMKRREEIKNKLIQPSVIVVQNIIRNDLSDLRSMVSCEYGAMVVGAADTQKFHHLANKNGASLSGRDRRIFNLFMKMSLRIIWLALQRPNIALLELELTRLTSTDTFNTFVHQGKKTSDLESTLAEDVILQGVANLKEPRILQHSPLGKEILIGNHDHRMLSIGQVKFPPSDERLRFFEAVFTAPEELFAELGITLGVLGLKRTEFDEMLVKKVEKKKKKEDEDSIEEEEEEEKPFEFTFIIPKLFIHSDDTIPDTYPEELPTYIKSNETIEMIKQHCEMWKEVVSNAHLGIPSPSISSYTS